MRRVLKVRTADARAARVREASSMVPWAIMCTQVTLGVWIVNELLKLVVF